VRDSYKSGLNVPDAYPFVGGHHTEDITTKGGLAIRAFSKEGSLIEKYQSDLWEDHVAPGLDTNLYVETWCHGGGDMRQCQTGKDSLCAGDCVCKAEDQTWRDVYYCQASKCGSKHRVQQITMLDLSGRVVKGRKIKSISSHNKWAISQDAEADEKWVCFGDINRQASQRKRGGGAICMQSDKHHRVMSNWVAEVDSCGA
jgi:hypothetical protein